jgi:hypothetical protein
MSGSRRTELSERDVRVLRLLLELRLLTTNQLERLVMTEGSAATRARRMRSVLQRLRRNRVVAQLDRRVGGIRAGSDGMVYRLTSRGVSTLNRLDGAERRRVGAEPGERYVRHVLAVSELYVSLTEQTRLSTSEVLIFAAEPAAWRSYPAPHGGTITLRPDAFVHTASDDYEDASFVEVDLATESLSTVSRKCRAYLAYWQSGVEQRRLGLFPRVVWVVPNVRRQQQLNTAIGRLPTDQRHLFAVTTPDVATDVLLGRTPSGDTT